MPTTYEALFILRVLRKPDIAAVIKRTALQVMEQGGFIRRIQSLGARQLPYRMRKDKFNYTEGHYFLMDFDAPPRQTKDLLDYFSRDEDLVRCSMQKKEEKEEIGPCTLPEECLPPPFRDDVKAMIEIGYKEKPQYDTGVDIYPFNK
ncbi:unnamed protein product [Cyprideis torosa]|uniref:Small ribosomal subunit protein bS6m n=1 Tax=Cyprideis torosa TaxID=163714 RepID=A0A7R8WCW8_9CRUS|nr:unnamed protein product [Cyprideis torosa]CAG0887964.1 unnamed protein product [Cyprideis torosa]